MSPTGDAVLSAFLQVVFQNIITFILDELKLEFGLEKELRKLMNTRSIIESLLKDAEEKQQTEEAVKKWLEQLRDIAYDTNDMLDEFATEAQRRQLVHFPKVRDSVSLINPKRVIFRHEIAHSLKGITERLDEMGKLKSSLGLTARLQEESGELPETSSLGSLSFVPLGREKDRERIVEFLVSPFNGAEETGVSVIPVLGMGGLGKTTLAQIVYNDEIVENHFELRLWIHVSRDFKVNKITKAIIEAADSSAFSPISLDGLHRHLGKRLSGRRYLIVLDDVWNENPREWGRLRAPLLCGARGSKILVTTRNEEVARVMGTVPPYLLGGLSGEDSWSLFCMHAGLNGGPSVTDSLRHEIVDMLKGLPLAAETIGFRLRREVDRRRWESILRDERWEFSGEDSDISRSVRSSYQALSAPLKLCFAYCSIFPQDFVFDKEQLVKLWMAQNFLHPRGGQKMEDVGRCYFDSLVGWSFFQYSHLDPKTKKPKYTMHGVIHEFARLVSGAESCITETGKPWKGSEKTRHASLIYGSNRPSPNGETNIFQKMYGSKGLYTLLGIGSSVYGFQVPKDLAKRLRYLRALDLSNSGISLLPRSIGDLKHLRYLQLRNTNIERLPESVGCLYNLQTLGLGNCYALKELPAGMSNLRRLRHLDLHLDEDVGGSSSKHPRWGSLNSMPLGIGKLTDLQTLSRFVVGAEKGCGSLSELQNLNNLDGEVRISNLHHVINAAGAMEADLSSKTSIQKLELSWSNNASSPLNKNAVIAEEDVLRLLRPHTNLKELGVIRYSGASFPSWVGDSSFSNLTTMVLSDCKRCATPPPFGQLPLLKSLYMKGMEGVMVMNCALCGKEPRRFPALEKLHLEGMSRLEVWCGDETCELPALRELVIKDCPVLRQLTHRLPSLAKLVIEGSPWLIGLPRFPSLHSLDVKASGEWIWASCPGLASLTSLTISQLQVESLTQQPRGHPWGPASLRRLEISECDRLICLPDDWLPASLTYFAVRHCLELRALPRGLESLQALEDMEIEDCPKLSAMPDRLPKPLQFLSVDNCPELRHRCLGQDRRKIAGVASVWIDKQPMVSNQR